MSPDSDTLSRAPGPPTRPPRIQSYPRALSHLPRLRVEVGPSPFFSSATQAIPSCQRRTRDLAGRSCQEGSAGRAACHLLSPVPAARPCSRRHSSHQRVFCHHTGERYVRRLQTDPVPDRPPARRLQTAGPPVTAAAPSAPRERTAPLYPSRWPARLRRATGVGFPVTATAPRCQPPGARTAPSLENSNVHAGGPCCVCFAPVCSLGLLTHTRLRALERRHRPLAGEELHQPTERPPCAPVFPCPSLSGRTLAVPPAAPRTGRASRDPTFADLSSFLRAGSTGTATAHPRPSREPPSAATQTPVWPERACLRSRSLLPAPEGAQSATRATLAPAGLSHGDYFLQRSEETF